jgi:multicomponent Na+:H+ antiporter subunit G
VTILGWVTVGLSLTGAVFFLAGTVGLLRLPDTCTRLHALTKADNLGIGFVVLALAVQADSPHRVLKLLLIWLLAMLASTNACFLLGRWALRHEREEQTR